MFERLKVKLLRPWNERFNMTQTIQISVVDKASNFIAPTSVDAVNTMAGPDGDTLTLFIDDRVANSASDTQALKATIRRQVLLQFV